MKGLIIVTKQYKNKINKMIFASVVNAIEMTKNLEVRRQDLKPYILTALIGMLDMEFFTNFLYIDNMINQLLADENLL